MTPTDTTNLSVIHTLTPLGYVIALAVTFLIVFVISCRVAMALAARGVDDTGKEVPWALLRTFPTTNGRIMVELALAILFVIVCMAADMIGHPVGEGTQNTLGLFIAAMLGIGAGQFFGKRKTDADYVAAKAQEKSTTVVADEANVTGSPVKVEEKG